MKDVLQLLRSVKLGIALLAVIGAASVAGTLYPMEESLALVFHSWWYIALLMALAVNVGLATWNTICNVIPGDRKPVFLRDRRSFEAMTCYEAINVSGARGDGHDGPDGPDGRGGGEGAAGVEALESALDAAQSWLAAKGYRVFREGRSLCAMRGLQSQVGAALSHAGIILIVIGAIIQAFLSVQGWVALEEGESTAVFALGESSEEETGTATAPLGATVTLRDFEVEHYPQSGAPAKFASHLAIEEKGVTRRETVEVNHSVKVDGYILHQNSYGEAAPPRDEAAREASKGAASQTAGEAPRDEPTTPTNSTASSKYEFELIDFVANLKVVDRKVVSEGDQWSNPAVQVAVFHNGAEARRAWLFYRPEFRDLMMAKGLPYHLRCVRLLPEGVSEPSPPTKTRLEDLRPLIEVRDSHEGPLLGTVELRAGQRVALPEAPAMESSREEPSPKPGAESGAEAKSYRTLVALDFDDGGQTRRVVEELNPGESVALEGNDVLDLVRSGAGVEARVTCGDGSARVFPLKKNAKSDERPAGAGTRADRYSLAGYEPVALYYSVLGVTRNPGIGPIYGGCFLLCLGPIMAFASRRRRILATADTLNGIILLGARCRYEWAVRRDLMEVKETLLHAICSRTANTENAETHRE